MNSCQKCTISIVATLLLLSPCFAKKRESTSGKESIKIADSGSFGVYVSGKRVATETFRIEQTETGGIAKSEFRTDSGEKVEQSAELQIAPNGDLKRYSWHELSPGKSQILVEPSEEFLLETVTPNPPDKPESVTLLLSISAPVLDDYFFSQREILLWRFLAQTCGNTITEKCALPKTQFGVLLPRQQTSGTVATEYKGKELVKIKGVEKSLDRFNITLEGEEWACYLDENVKLVKIDIPAFKTEVVRD